MSKNKISHFDMEKAKEGAAVVSRDGRPVRILLFDRDNDHFPIVAIIENKQVECYTAKGRWYKDKRTSENDLFLAE